jgi:hypothetical protein
LQRAVLERHSSAFEKQPAAGESFALLK